MTEDNFNVLQLSIPAGEELPKPKTNFTYTDETGEEKEVFVKQVLILEWKDKKDETYIPTLNVYLEVDYI